MSEGDQDPVVKPDSTWEKCKFIITHIRSIAIAGAIIWFLAILSLQITGVVDMEVTCPPCSKLLDRLIEKVVASASAAGSTPIEEAITREAPIQVRVTLFP